MNLKEHSSSHKHFKALTRMLDWELFERYGDAQAAFDPHNRLTSISTALVGYEDGTPVACGCFKKISGQKVEIKRMFVVPEFRGKGTATVLLTALEYWAARLGFSIARIETGKGQPEAISLYKKAGYVIIPNFSPYEGVDNVICMEKGL